MVVLRLVGAKGEDKEYVKRVVKIIGDKIRYKKRVLLAGDFWSFLCDKLKLESYVRERSGVNGINDLGQPQLSNKWRDDYVCGKGFDQNGKWKVLTAAFMDGTEKQYKALHDHPAVTLTVDV